MADWQKLENAEFLDGDTGITYRFWHQDREVRVRFRKDRLQAEWWVAGMPRTQVRWAESDFRSNEHGATCILVPAEALAGGDD